MSEIPTPRTDAMELESKSPMDGAIDYNQLRGDALRLCRTLERELATLGAVVRESQPWRGELAAMKIELNALRRELELERDKRPASEHVGMSISELSVKCLKLQNEVESLRQANERLEKERDAFVTRLKTGTHYDKGSKIPNPA